ncbi:hypothetical protein [Helicobacter cetorum]|uniref:hypothetical protein n=1 Tax=Helicobacter cetorum TaxID=138563 RepID=UPI000CF09138|nr:hypothetical protein [Helicobacter cetorum]
MSILKDILKEMPKGIDRYIQEFKKEKVVYLGSDAITYLNRNARTHEEKQIIDFVGILFTFENSYEETNFLETKTFKEFRDIRKALDFICHHNDELIKKERDFFRRYNDAFCRFDYPNYRISYEIPSGLRKIIDKQNQKAKKFLIKMQKILDRDLNNVLCLLDKLKDNALGNFIGGSVKSYLNEREIFFKLIKESNTKDEVVVSYLKTKMPKETLTIKTIEMLLSLQKHEQQTFLGTKSLEEIESIARVLEIMGLFFSKKRCITRLSEYRNFGVLGYEIKDFLIEMSNIISRISYQKFPYACHSGVKWLVKKYGCNFTPIGSSVKSYLNERETFFKLIKDSNTKDEVVVSYLKTKMPKETLTIKTIEMLLNLQKHEQQTFLGTKSLEEIESIARVLERVDALPLKQDVTSEECGSCVRDYKKAKRFKYEIKSFLNNVFNIISRTFYQKFPYACHSSVNWLAKNIDTEKSGVNFTKFFNACKEWFLDEIFLRKHIFWAHSFL